MAMSGQGLGLLICVVILGAYVLIPYVVFVLEAICLLVAFLLGKLTTSLGLLIGKLQRRQNEDQHTNG